MSNHHTTWGNPSSIGITTSGTIGTITTGTFDNTFYSSNEYIPESITIKDEYGNNKTLELAEVTRIYAESLDYHEILRFARIFPEVKSILKELRVMMKLVDPCDDEELLQIEQDSKNNK